MKVLLMQQPKSFSNYPKWIEEIQERFNRLEVMVFTSNDRAAHHSWPNSVIKEIVVSDYSSDSATAEFFDIVRKFKPDRIISSSEEDVLRVAEARSLFGIPGLQYELALRCRDKVTMKQTALNAGLKVIPYTSCKSFGDIISAFDRWKTVVLKPRWGAGSAGITILHSKDDLSVLATKPEFVKNIHSNQYYLEEYCSCGCSLYQFRFDPDFTVTISCPATRFRETKHRFRNVRRERRRLFRTAPADKATH